MLKRKLTRSSLSITRKSGLDITTTRFSALSSYGHSNQGSTTLPDQEIVEDDYEALRSVLLNISESVAQIQERKSSEDLDILKNIADTKAQLVALYNSIGYTTGIESLLDNEKEGVRLGAEIARNRAEHAMRQKEAMKPTKGEK